MSMKADCELLRQYVEEGCEAAFAELVRRHVDLVYSVAWRLGVGDSDLAQDVTQIVFRDLALKARSLCRRATLAGWLHTSARFAAVTLIRREHRRHAREDKALDMHDSTSEQELSWEHLRPVLDEALGQLKDSDREAVLLRFVEQKSLRDIGFALGLNENAARMRVERAIEKLRLFLTRKGVTSTASTLSAILIAKALTAAPAGLASTVAGAALASAAVNTSVTLALLNMTMTKLQLGTVATLVLAGLITPLVLQTQSLGRLRAENKNLLQLSRETEQLAQERDRLAKSQVTAAERKRSSDEHAELLRLRGQVGVLRSQLAGFAQAPDTAQSNPPENGTVDDAVSDAPAVVWELGTYLSSEDWADVGLEAPENALQTLFWARKAGDTNRLAQITMDGVVRSDVSAAEVESKIRSGLITLAPAMVVAQLPDYRQIQGGKVAWKQQASPREVQLNVDEDWPDGGKVQSVLRFRLDGNEWKYAPGLIRGR